MTTAARPAGPRETAPNYPAVAMGEAFPALEAAYRGVTRVLADLDPGDFVKPTLCSAWVVSDLTFHLMLDAQRALIALASPCETPADVDYVTYWRAWSSTDDSAIAHSRFVRIAASAYASPKSLVDHRRLTAEAALRAAGAAPGEWRVATQGHCLAVPDFLATLAVEATIHHLDLIAELDRPRLPEPASLALVRRTLDGLAGAPIDAGWDDVTYALKATGRSSLTDSERERLGRVAELFPLFS